MAVTPPAIPPAASKIRILNVASKAAIFPETMMGAESLANASGASIWTRSGVAGSGLGAQTSGTWVGTGAIDWVSGALLAGVVADGESSLSSLQAEASATMTRAANTSINGSLLMLVTPAVPSSTCFHPDVLAVGQYPDVAVLVGPKDFGLIEPGERLRVWMAESIITPCRDDRHS